MEQGEEEEKKSSTKLLQKQRIVELSAIFLAQRLEYMGSEEIPVE